MAACYILVHSCVLAMQHLWSNNGRHTVGYRLHGIQQNAACSRGGVSMTVHVERTCFLLATAIASSMFDLDCLVPV